MTVDHPIAPWGYGTGATLAGTQRARRIGRNRPVDRLAGASLRPYVIPWTRAADNWGVAFPAGIVGIVTAWPTLSGVGTYAEQFVEGWEDGSGLAALVPGVLPPDYTPRLQREWHSGTVNMARLRTATGYTSHTWLPSSTPLGTSFTWGQTTAFDSFNSIYSSTRTFDAATVWYWRNILFGGTATIGWRKVQYRAVTFGFGGSPAGLGRINQTHTVTLSHDTNGGQTVNFSSPYTGSRDGTEIDSVTTFDTHDQTINLFSDYYATDWIDAGEVPAADVGTLTIHTIDFSMPLLGGGAGTHPHYLEFRLSPALDVPYPVTATGQGDLIAPGGVPT